MLMNLFAELRQALRSLLRSPGFTLPVVLVLGLGMGANVALYSILQTVLSRPLPIVNRDAVVLVKFQVKGEKTLWPCSHAQFEELQQLPGPFVGMSEYFDDAETTLRVGDQWTDAAVTLVGQGWFQLLGLKPSLGRAFTQEEEVQGLPVAVVSDRWWRTAFRSDPAILGRTFVTSGSGVPVTVVGVAPARFEGLELGRHGDLWMPVKSMVHLDPTLQKYLTNRGRLAFNVAARMKPGATLTMARAALDAASARQATGNAKGDWAGHFLPETLGASEQKLLDSVLPRRTLLVIAAGLALLLAVVASSGLFGARAARREKEMATRCALGATWRDLGRPLLLEASLLAFMAAPVALGSGLACARSLMVWPGDSKFAGRLQPALDGRILALGMGLSLAALLLAALLPLIRLRQLDPAQVLTAHGSASPAGGSGFVMAQVALSMVLLAASSMALGAFRSAARMGFPTSGRALMVVRTQDDPGLPERLVARLRAMPGIVQACQGLAAPLDNFRFIFGIRGGEHTQLESFPGAVVGGNWFTTLGVNILEGRDFNDQDGRDKIMLNETLARRFFPTGSAVGRMIEKGEDRLEVVGVVVDHRMRADPGLHIPMLWLTRGWLRMGQSCLMVQGAGSGKALLGQMREALAMEKPGVEPEGIKTMEEQVARTLYTEHQNLRLLGTLGLGSMLLACFGLWAALNLQVVLRGREWGIRAALGAAATDLARCILGRGIRSLFVGLGAGATLICLLGSLAGERWPDLPRVSVVDGLASFGALVAAGLLACMIPAMRAAKINPADAMRRE